jgi:hypothetical protein
VQLQFQGPVPVTAEGVPALQRFAEGVEKEPCPFAVPQAPLTSRPAKQFAVDPPFNPAQIQFHGPVPVMAEGVPALQRFTEGADKEPCPSAGPQAPLTSRLAEQFAVDPPFNPAQIQFHGPVPVMAEGVPALQRFAEGATKDACPFAEPQAPLTSRFAEQPSVAPPFDPAQVQFQGPVPVTPEGVPALQRFAEGVVKEPCPFAESQAPSIGVPEAP